jgi:multiple sugar transport system permease protein
MIDRYSPDRARLHLSPGLLHSCSSCSPFIEGFLVSLEEPLCWLFSTTRSGRKTDHSRPYFTMWVSVPSFGRYIFNSLFISVVSTVIVLILVVPAACICPVQVQRHGNGFKVRFWRFPCSRVRFC